MILISEMIRDDFTSQFVYDELENLVSLAREEINQARPQDWQLEKLLELFYGEWGFCDTRGVYRLSDALWLDQVLKNRQGSAVALGSILLWVAHRLDIPLVPVIFPTQMILRAEWLDGEMWLINPFNGDTLDEHTLDVWLKGNISPVAELFNEDLDEADNAEVIRKLLDEADPVSVISESMLADMRLLNDSHKGEIVKAGDELIDVYTEIEASVGSNGITGVPTGYDELDRIGGGLQPGLIILAARPSVGKTTFALNIARNVANNKFIVLIFSLEMTKKQLIRKLLAMEANIDSKYFNNAGEINDTQWTRLSHALGSLHEAGIYLDDTSGLKASEIMVKSRRFKSLHPELKMIIIDYLQLIAPENNYGTTNDKISDTSKIVKLVAKELDLPVVALSQLSRSLETRKDKTPILADLRDSGSLEQDADVVMFLHRDDYYNPKDAPADPSYTDLIVAKNRLDGGVGAVELKYYKARQRFEPAKQNYPQVKTR